jgi:hypothetical protein
MPRDVEAALLAVLHTADHSGSMLPQILQRRSNLPVSHPCDRDPIQRGRVYRPAIDPLFRSAAGAYGRRVIGVILTGMLGDGTAGLMVVSARGAKPSFRIRKTLPFLPCREVRWIKCRTHMYCRWTRSRPSCCNSLERSCLLKRNPPVPPPRNTHPLVRPRKRALQSSIWMRFQVKIAWVIHRRSPVLIAVVCFGRLSRVGMAGRAKTSHHELPARLYQERASNTESNAKILRDFLLRVNLEESGSYAENGLTESVPASSGNSDSI